MQEPQIRKVRRFCTNFVPRSDIIQDKKTRLGYIKQKMIICTLGRNCREHGKGMRVHNRLYMPLPKAITHGEKRLRNTSIPSHVLARVYE